MADIYSYSHNKSDIRWDNKPESMELFPPEIWSRILKYTGWAAVGQMHDVSHMMRTLTEAEFLRGDVPIREALMADSVTLVRNSVGPHVKSYVMHVIIALATQMKAWKVLVNYTSLHEYS